MTSPRFKALLTQLSPWACITVLGCICLTLIDLWRDQGHTDFIFLRGVLPNLIAVPTMVFGFMLFRFPNRGPYSEERSEAQNTLFRQLLITLTLGIIFWEFLQLSGNLVFDYFDLLATLIGCLVTLVLYLALRNRSFIY